MKIYIPNIGEKLILNQTWTFNLVKSHKNKGLFEALAAPYFEGVPFSQGNFIGSVSLPAGTKLVVEEIHIGKKTSNTVVFSVLVNNKKCKFFANIADVNNVSFL